MDSHHTEDINPKGNSKRPYDTLRWGREPPCSYNEFVIIFSSL